MKVLHILNELRASGAEIILCSAAPYWQKAGVKGEVLATGSTTGSYALKMKGAGFRVHHIPFRKRPIFFLSFYRLLRRQKPDVVHLHCERASFYYALVSRLAASRVLRTIHASFAFQDFLALKRSIQRNLLHLIGCVQVSVSPSVQKTERKYLHNRTVLITNWYDNKRFVPLSEEQSRKLRHLYGITNANFTLVSVGNCAPVKNHAELLKALAKIGRDIEFVYLHVGQEERGEPERKLANELGIADRVRFLGYTQDVLPPLHAADVFVMPSLREGFGLAALEAMGAGLPVILAEVPGLVDFKTIGEIFWAKPNSDSLAETLTHVAKMPPDKRHAIGRRLHEAVKSRYGINRGAPAYLEIYRRKSPNQ